MSEPDEETLRRWQQYSQAPGSSAPAPESQRATSASSPPVVGAVRRPLPARHMAGLGLAILAVLGVVAFLITWQPGGSASKGTSQVRGADPDTHGGTGKPHNLVSVNEPLKGTGTVLSGVPVEPGHFLSYMVDGDPRTSWQMSGPGTGRAIRLELDGTYRISEVGLSTVATGVRPLIRVTWSFKDQAATREQILDPGSTALQRIDIPPVETDAVTLTLDEVGAAPEIDADSTGISEVQIIGY